MAHLANRFIASTILAVLGSLEGCATHDGRARAPATMLTALATPRREACEALAREEAAVVRRHDAGLWPAEREAFLRYAETIIADVGELGYYQTTLGGIPMSVDARIVVAIVPMTILLAEWVALPVTRAARRAQREALAYDVTLRDCATAFAIAEPSAPDEVELAQALHRTGLRYLAQGDFAEAERLFKRALAIRGEHVFAARTAVAATLQALVGIYQARGDHGEAARLQAWLRQPVQPEPPAPLEIVESPVAPCAGPTC